MTINGSKKKPGPKKKQTVSLKIELLPKQVLWLESLVTKARFGPSPPTVAANLLNAQFTFLLEKGELHEHDKVPEVLAFPPTPDSQSKNPSTSTTQPHRG
jgi:hypothetical protein